MKILMVQRFDLANVGCAERIWRQAEELSARGHEVNLVNYPHPERRSTHTRLRPDCPKGVRLLDLDRRSQSMRANARHLRVEIEGVDLVHLWKAYPDTALPVLAGLRKTPRPLHYDWDDLEGGSGGIAERLTESPLVGGLLAYWEREILKWADTVTVASRELEGFCREEGFCPDRIFPGPVGAADRHVREDLAKKWRDETHNKKTLLFLGQMEAEDFPEAILEAVNEVCDRVPETLLLMVGDGAGREILSEKSRQLGIEDRVRFTGYLPWEEAQAILSISDVFLFPLRDDRMSRCKSPLVVVEALAQGVPVVASDVGETPGMIGETGMAVPSLDPKIWAENICALLNDDTRRAELGKKARLRFGEHWTWARSVDHLEEAYRKAVEISGDND